MHIQVTVSPSLERCLLCGGESAMVFVVITENGTFSSPPTCLGCMQAYQIQIEAEEIQAKPDLRKRARAQIRSSRRQENKLAEAVGGRRQKASGALPWAKGDVRKRGELRIEAKQTQAKSFRLQRSDLEKIRSECSYNETPHLSIWFCGSTGRPEEKWILLPEASWRRLRDGQADNDKRSG